MGGDSALHTDASVVLGRLALALADGAPVAEALGLLVEGLDLRSAVLRRSGRSELLAVAGEVVHAVPAMRPPGTAALHPAAPVDLPVPGDGGRDLGVLTVVGARPSLLPALRAAAAVLGLALAAPAPDVLAAEAGALLLDAEEDGDLLADDLHDGPVQVLVAARYACDVAVRGGDPALARDAVQEALVALRRTLWHLRPRTDGPLPDALHALRDRLAEAGGPPLVLVLDLVSAERLDPAARAVAYRLVQAVARDTAEPVRVGLRSGGPEVLLDVDGGRALPGPDRWRRRLRALGGDLSSSAGRLRVHLPAGPPPDPDPAARAARAPLPTTSPTGTDDPKACS